MTSLLEALDRFALGFADTECRHARMLRPIAAPGAHMVGSGARHKRCREQALRERAAMLGARLTSAGQRMARRRQLRAGVAQG